MSGEVNTSLQIFRRANNTNYSYMKFSEFIISNNDIIKKDFVTCYRKSDNKPGLYDIVEGKFYTNQGTGDFVKGPDI